MQDFSASDDASRAMAPQMEIFGLRSNGIEFPLESTISHSMIGGKLQMTAVLRDVTERRKTESALRTLNTQLRELSANLQDVREEERKRFSRELHDDLGQRLTGLKLSLSWLASRLKEGKPTAVSDVDEMRHQMDAAIGSVRRIAAELRPRVMDDLDFKEALTWQTQEFFKHSGIQIELDLRAADRVTEDGLATALFRIVQESLTNVVRHSSADKVEVSLHQENDQLKLVISDNGRGFDRGGTVGGVGLVSMRERCGAIGAAFSVNSYPGAGTRIEITVPITDKIRSESTT
jgi:signal transduction histidine kinase